MFGYFGTKRRLAPTYPVPTHELIVEPFAGAAAYSMLHAHHEVLLIDADPNVISVWHYLQAATPAELELLPDLEGNADDGYRYPITDCEDPRYWLMRWSAGNQHNSSPNVPGSRMAAVWPTVRARLGRNVHRVRHWDIRLGTYTDAPDVAATWYIDPPYQHFGGSGNYTVSADLLDFTELGQWCMARRGQLIVTEQEPADWLPFEVHTANLNAGGDLVTELIYTNTPPLTLFGDLEEEATA